MLYSEYLQLLDDGTDFGIDSSISISSFNEKCTANDSIALALTATSPMHERDTQISIESKDSSLQIGSLITCKDCDFNYGEATQELVAAYLMDAGQSDVIDSQRNPRRDFKFKRDYVVVNVTNYADYVSIYRKSSALWGGFTHTEEQPNPPIPYKNSTQIITAVPNIKDFTENVNDALWRAVNHFSPHERYLKLYHLLELDFDLQLINQLRNIGDDLKDIGKLLNSYNGDKEFDRLLKIVRRSSLDIQFFERILIQAFSNPAYKTKWYDILFEYSKDSNPYNNQSELIKDALESNFTNVNWTTGRSKQYNNLSKFAAYMIYRVRSSIAHSKIGEYILSSADEAFVAESAEPLLREIVLATYIPPNTP